MPKRMKQPDLILYTWDELDEDAKQKAWEEYAESEVLWGNWYEFTLDQLKDALEYLGFSISGGRRGPDFEWEFDRYRDFKWKGSYGYEKGAPAKIQKEFGWDHPESWGKKLVPIAKRLQELQKKHFYCFTASGEFPYFSSWEPEVYIGGRWIDIDIPPCREFEEIFLDISKWAIGRIEAEYEYLVSEEHAVETFQEMNYYFRKDGEIEIWGHFDEELLDCEDEQEEGEE